MTARSLLEPDFFALALSWGMHSEGPWLKDDVGRTLLLRGVNLGGSSKVPMVPNGATQIRQDLREHRHVSFVGGPFPLAGRMSTSAGWLPGAELSPLCHHLGSGRARRARVSMTMTILTTCTPSSGKAAEHGLSVYIDPHQDVGAAPLAVMAPLAGRWKRWVSTSATCTRPALPLCIRPRRQAAGSDLAEQRHQAGGAMMFALFFAGADFAPRLRVDGTDIQSYLQRHYIAALCRVAERLADRKNVVGYGSMNEPMPGFLGCRFQKFRRA